MKNINIITVNYNSSQATIQMLESLKSSFSYIRNIIIVDNKSDMEEQTLLDHFLKSDDIYREVVHIYKLENNIGYFPGLNYGLAQVDNTTATYTIIGNNDLIYPKDFLSYLLKKQWASNVMAIAPSVVTIDGIYQNPSVSKPLSKFKKIFYRIYYSNYYLGQILLSTWRLLGLGIDTRNKKDPIEKEIFIGIGAIYILRPNFFTIYKKLNYPGFLYGEEAFFSKQLADAHGILWYDPQLEVTHLESVSTAKLPTKNKYLLNKEAYFKFKSYL